MLSLNIHFIKSCQTIDIVSVNNRQLQVTNSVHAITAMPQYETKSNEEIRYEDYMKLGQDQGDFLNYVIY